MAYLIREFGISTFRAIHEQVTERLRAELVNGSFPPGEPLREETLVGRYSVGRATVRQAFGQLVQEGLLVAKRNCGVRVAQPPADAVRSLLMPMRVQVEAFALSAALPGFTADDFRVWDRLVSRIGRACDDGDYPAAIERDFEFHRHLIVRGGLTDLLPLWATLIAKTSDFYRHRELAPADLPAVHEMHAELVALFRRGELAPAVVALTQHIMNGEFNERIRQRWSASKPRPTRPRSGRSHPSPSPRSS